MSDVRQDHQRTPPLLGSRSLSPSGPNPAILTLHERMVCGLWPEVERSVKTAEADGVLAGE